jgi:hypothetical protein
MGVVVLAHQGGWDELLFVLTPIALFAWLLHVANKRASRMADDDTNGDGGTDHPPPPSS